MFSARASLALLLLAATAAAQQPRVDDPMRPYVTMPTTSGTTVAVEQFELTAVLVSPARRIAVINGRFYREGDRINGDEITRIEPGSIRIRRGNEVVLVNLREEKAMTATEDGERGQ